MQCKGIIATGKSLLGAGKQKNEDRFLIKVLDESNLIIAVADGMGGHPAGDLAAEEVVSCLGSIDRISRNNSVKLLEAVALADTSIKNKVTRVPQLEGMGTTATAAIISTTRVWWAHIGDSRLYLFRNGILAQVTRDHSFLQDLIDAGDISAKEAEEHPMSHVLDQCVGCMDKGPDSGEFAFLPGDILLFCTDGFYRTVPEEEIFEILGSEDSVSGYVERLLKRSQRWGAKDDSTVVVVSTDSPRG